MKSSEVRETFLKFFEGKGHQRVRSSSLIPAADPTLLFNNAGMNQFKDCFLGLHDPGYRRATTSQKCVRAGGKHNDLENVGFTARHHTFFEMLGNFSFGDYFKKDAIAFAWELLTKQYKIPAEKLRVTVFETDDEAFDLWKSVGVKPEMISRLGEKDNFWAMGDTGPCGPCTEIHYDWGVERAFGPDDTAAGGDSTRFVEIWNLVFMQFNRDASGKLTPLPKPSVDTGAGLERVSAVMQGVYSNYDTDLFLPLLHAISKITNRPYKNSTDPDSFAMRVVADHMRSGSFLLSDGVNPSNEGRGYVLRRILRRAIRYGKKLGQDKPFLHELVGTVCQELGSVYPDLVKNRKLIEEQMKEEEVRFHETLHRGMGILEESISTVKKEKKEVIPGAVAFKLYDTFGFPFDLIEVIAKENSLHVDEKGFQELMEKQRSQSVFNKDSDSAAGDLQKALGDQQGQVDLKSPSAQGSLKVLVTSDGKTVSELRNGTIGWAFFDTTSFYAEGGGQVGDKGSVTGREAFAEVLTTKKVGKATVHKVEVKNGSLKVGDSYTLKIDHDLRRKTARNHTATHMLQAALKTVLGDRVKQAGSLVDPNRLRFDFTYPRGLSPEEIKQVEGIVTQHIESGDAVSHQEKTYDEAIKGGALAFFDEKYGDRVKVLAIGPADGNHFSMELCGGTHVDNSAEIGAFKIVSESSVSSGVRRIEAVTSTAVRNYLDEANQKLAEKIETQQAQIKTQQKEIESLKLKLVQGGGGGGKSSTEGSLWDRKILIKDIQVVREMVPSVNPKILRTLVDQIRDKLQQKAVVFLGSVTEGKLSMCVGLTKDLTERWSAGDMIKPLAVEVGGTGGGKPDFAQAGGTKPEGFEKAVQVLEDWIKSNA